MLLEVTPETLWEEMPNVYGTYAVPVQVFPVDGTVLLPLGLSVPLTSQGVVLKPTALQVPGGLYYEGVTVPETSPELGNSYGAFSGTKQESVVDIPIPFPDEVVSPLRVATEVDSLHPEKGSGW